MAPPVLVLTTRQQDPPDHLLARALAPARGLAARMRERLRAVRPEAWFGLVLGLLLITFVVVLFLQPTVGRGGR